MMKKILFSLLCLIGISSLQMVNARIILGRMSVDGKTVVVRYTDSYNPSTDKQPAEWGDWKDVVETVIIDESMQESQATTMAQWFSGFTKLASIEGLANLNTAKVTTMWRMFYDCRALTSLDLSNFNTEAVTDVREMFYNCNKLTALDLSSFNTENMEQMYGMFFFCSKLETLNLSNFKLSKALSTERMFSNCSKLATIYCNDDWSKYNVLNSDEMFKNCAALIAGNGTVYDAEKINIEYARPDLINQAGYFTYGACQTPSKPVVASLTYNQAVITWEPVGGEKQWTVFVGIDGYYSKEYYVNEPTITLANLTPETNYGVYVVANCTNSSSSERTGAVSFTTPAIPTCPVPDLWAPADEITYNSITLHVNSTSGEYWNIRYREKGQTKWISGGSNNKVMTITDLKPATVYEFQAQTSCGSEDESEWTPICSFSTKEEPVCPAVTKVLVSDPTHNSANIEIVSEGESWNIRYRAEGATEWEVVKATSKKTQLTGLQPLTKYELEVQTDCGEKQSDWFKALSFWTNDTPAEVDKTELNALLAEMKALYDYAINVLKIDAAQLKDYKSVLDLMDAVSANPAATQQDVDDAVAAGKLTFQTGVSVGLKVLKDEVKESFNSLLEEGDSEACQQIVADACAKIDALSWDYDKTVEENIKILEDATNYDVLMALKEALRKQREWEKTHGTPFAVCDFTKKANGYNQYVSPWTYDESWVLLGGHNNSAGWDYAKFGGKSQKNAYVRNKTAFDKAVKEIAVTYPAGSLPKGSMSVDEWGVMVFQNAEYADADLLYTVKGNASDITKEEAVLSLVPEDGQPWLAGYGFQVYWNVTTSDNGVVWVSKLEFFEDKNPQGVESVQTSEVSIQKVIRNGQLFIESNGRTFNAQGAEVK